MDLYTGIVVGFVALSVIGIVAYYYLFKVKEKFEDGAGDGAVAGGQIFMSKGYCTSIKTQMDSYIKVKNDNKGKVIKNLDEAIEQLRGYLDEYKCMEYFTDAPSSG